MAGLVSQNLLLITDLLHNVSASVNEFVLDRNVRDTQQDRGMLMTC